VITLPAGLQAAAEALARDFRIRLDPTEPMGLDEWLSEEELERMLRIVHREVVGPALAIHRRDGRLCRACQTPAPCPTARALGAT